MRSNGFTIVETLVAIAILTTVIVGAMSAVGSGLSAHNNSKDQIIAYFLAQEAIEQIKNFRDENRLLNRNWLYGISNTSGDPCYFGNACYVDVVTATSPVRCSAVGSCPYIRKDTTSSFYGYNSSWGLTGFRREITLSSINSQEVMVTVTVNWSKGPISRQFKAKQSLFNWQ